MSYPTRDILLRTDLDAFTSESNVVGDPGAVEAFGHNIKGLANPIDIHDAVNKQYMDAFRLIGDMKMSVIANDHNYWLLCDGRSLDITEYSQLFALIGYAYGGSGSSFNIPNCAGQVLGTISKGNVLGTSIGEELHTMTIDDLISHNHSSTAMTLAGSHNHTGDTGSAGSHNHTLASDSHNHLIQDNCHFHQIQDFSHTHTQYTYNQSFNLFGPLHPAFEGDSAGHMTWHNILGSTTGITVNNATTGITLNNASTGISINNNSTQHEHTISVDNNHDHDVTIGETGSSTPFNVMQPTLFIANTFIFGD